MILFPAPGGRLGNLLFQWAFIESIRKEKEFIFASQLKSLNKIIGPFRRVFYTDKRWFIRFLDYILIPLFLRPMVSIGVFGKIEEINGQIVSKNGLLPIRVIRGYFQIGSAGQLDLIKKLKENQIQKLDPNRKNLFVHVRRGDYVEHQFGNGINPLLPKKFYFSGIKKLQELIPEAKIFFVGDSPDWCQENFKEIPNVEIMRQSPISDLVLMSLCDGGVVSNSTFAWWGAQFCKKSVPIIGPKYWMGWRVKSWFPVSIETKWINYLEVEE